MQKLGILCTRYHGTGSPRVGLFDPEPSMLVLIYLSLRQPSVGAWVCFTRVPGYKQPVSWTQARTWHVAEAEPQTHQGPPHLDAACSPRSWGGGACLLGLLVTSAQWLAPDPRQSPWKRRLLLLLPSASALCSFPWKAAGHTPSRHFSGTLGSRPGARQLPILGREEGGSRPWGTGCCLWSPSCQVGDLS